MLAGPMVVVACGALACGSTKGDCNPDPVTTFLMRANPLCYDGPPPAPPEEDDATATASCIAVEGEPACPACVRAHCCAPVVEYASCTTSCAALERAAAACERRLLCPGVPAVNRATVVLVALASCGRGEVAIGGGPGYCPETGTYGDCPDPGDCPESGGDGCPVVRTCAAGCTCTGETEVCLAQGGDGGEGGSPVCAPNGAPCVVGDLCCEGRCVWRGGRRGTCEPISVSASVPAPLPWTLALGSGGFSGVDAGAGGNPGVGGAGGGGAP